MDYKTIWLASSSSMLRVWMCSQHLWSYRDAHPKPLQIPQKNQGWNNQRTCRPETSKKVTTSSSMICSRIEIKILSSCQSQYKCEDVALQLVPFKKLTEYKKPFPPKKRKLNTKNSSSLRSAWNVSLFWGGSQQPRSLLRLGLRRHPVACGTAQRTWYDFKKHTQIVRFDDEM